MNVDVDVEGRIATLTNGILGRQHYNAPYTVLYFSHRKTIDELNVGEINAIRRINVLERENCANESSTKSHNCVAFL